MELCEENYRLFLRLVPQVRVLEGNRLSRIADSTDLHLRIEEQTPYTTLVRLTYLFPNAEERLPDPDALLRIYHDARQTEILELRQKVLPLNSGPQLPTLRQKWRANLFLSKWLIFSIQQGHGFSTEAPTAVKQPSL